MLKHVFVITFLLISLQVYAQDNNALDNKLKDVAGDLAILHKELGKWTAQAMAVQGGGAFKKQLQSVTVTVPKGKILAGATANSDIVQTVDKGEKLAVVDSAGDWYAVAKYVPLQSSGNMKAMGWINAADVVPEATFIGVTSQTGNDLSFLQSLYDKAIDGVIAFKAKYESDPLIKVTGFTVTISVPPGVDIAFEFVE